VRRSAPYYYTVANNIVQRLPPTPKTEAQECFSCNTCGNGKRINIALCTHAAHNCEPLIFISIYHTAASCWQQQYAPNSWSPQTKIRNGVFNRNILGSNTCWIQRLRKWDTPDHRHRHLKYMFLWDFISGFGGLEVACWPLVPKFVGSNPAEAVAFFGRKNPQHAFLRRGSIAVCPMSCFTACKRPQNWRGSRHFRQNSRPFLAHSSTFRCWVP
jgi:hypothetical protein